MQLLEKGLVAGEQLVGRWFLEVGCCSAQARVFDFQGAPSTASVFFLSASAGEESNHIFGASVCQDTKVSPNKFGYPHEEMSRRFYLFFCCASRILNCSVRFA